jgi:sulfoxide reductase heme-binding subunit YedZ
MWLKPVIWVLGLAPFFWGIGGFFRGALGANPIEALLHLGGRWGLVFLLLGLAVSPVRRLTGWAPIIKVRRLLGLFAFFYAAFHFAVYLVLDQGLAWSYILEDIADRPFITVGFASMVLLLPLAVTSTRGWIRRLGRQWQRLHRLVYPAAGLAVLHFFWNAKADTFWPLVAAGILALLLFLRVPVWLERSSVGKGRGPVGRSGRGGSGIPRERLAEGS